MLFFGATANCIPWVYVPEILPLHARAKGTAVGISSNWLWVRFYLISSLPSALPFAMLSAYPSALLSALLSALSPALLPVLLPAVSFLPFPSHLAQHD